MNRESEIQRKMQQKLENARKHRDCMLANCIIGDPDECPHQDAEIHPQTGQPVTKKKEPNRPLPCPKCGGALDTLEVSYGQGVTDDGIWVTDSGDMWVSHSGGTDDLGDMDTVGALCSECDWRIERPDWFEYLKDYEANEVKRIKEEFLAVKEGREPEETSTRYWSVPLNHGQIQIVIPVPNGDPIEMTLDMNEMDGPQDIHVDPDKRTVSFTTDDPLVEVTE